MPNLGKVPVSGPVRPEYVQRGNIVKNLINRGNKVLNRVQKKILRLNSAQPSVFGIKIKKLILGQQKGSTQFNLSKPVSLYLSNRRFTSEEGIISAEKYAKNLEKYGPVVAEGMRVKGVMQRMAYYASQKGTNQRGLDLVNAVLRLGPEAALILAQTGFLDRLTSLGSSSVKQFSDTAQLVQSISTAPSGQWQSILQELANAKALYPAGTIK